MSAVTRWRAPSSGWRRNSRGAGAVEITLVCLQSLNSCDGELCLFRCSGLSEVSTLLRSQLSQSSEANEALRDDLRKLTADWSKALEEVVQKEIDWQKEKEVRSKYMHGYCIFISKGLEIKSVNTHTDSIFNVLETLCIGRSNSDMHSLFSRDCKRNS